MVNFNPCCYRLKDIAFPVEFALIRYEAPVVIVLAILSTGSDLMVPWILLSSRLLLTWTFLTGQVITTAFLRCNSRTVCFTHLKYARRWLLMQSQSCVRVMACSMANIRKLPAVDTQAPQTTTHSFTL